MSTEVVLSTTVRFYTSSPFTKVDGTIADPTEVLFGFQIDGGQVNQVQYGSPASWGTIVRDSTGVYHIDIDTDDPTVGGAGVWSYVWAGFGVVQVSDEQTITVYPRKVGITGYQ